MTPKDWLDLIKTKPVAFGWENGFTDLTNVHNGWLKSFLFGQEDQTLQAHRGSYKTTTLEIAIALMMIIYPNESIIFLRKTDDDVKEVINTVGKLLESDMFQHLSQSLYGAYLFKTRESAFEIDTNLNGMASATSQLRGLGINASLTGKHADIVITDDIINLKDRISRAEREHTKAVYQELENIKNRGGRFINTGTPWHKEDAFTLMPEADKHDCYSTGLISDSQLQDLRQSMTPSLFSANYELKHIADEEALFTSPQFYDWTTDGLLFGGLGHLDASYGGKDGTAFTLAKRSQDGNIYVLGKLWQKHVDDCLPEIEALRKRHRIGTVYLETNADKGYLADKLSEPTSTYHENMNKYVKISTYLRSRWKDIIFVKETDPEYISQILDYTENAEHDDAPDSLASLIRESESTSGLQAIGGFI